MQTLKLDWNLRGSLISGTKRCTIRKDLKTITPGILKFIYPNAPEQCYGLFDLVRVTKVTFKQFKYVTAEEAYLDGGLSLEKLYHSLLNYYPDLEPWNVVTVIEFDAIPLEDYAIYYETSK